MMRWTVRSFPRAIRGAPLGVTAALCASLAACGGETARSGPSNDLLIVGYDREPDTMNRYATHILEDIEAGVVEGLVTNDEEMKIIPVLAA
jgi:ABC-type oligopeptide transport system substrate-binding subunit